MRKLFAHIGVAILALAAAFAAPGRPCLGAEVRVAVSDLRAGAVLLVDGEPLVLYAPEAEPGDRVPAGQTGGFVVAVEDPEPAGLDIMIPISIEDARIGVGTRVQLSPAPGEVETFLIPPRKVLFPFPFNVPAGEFGALSPDGSERGRLLLMVMPRITKKARVAADQTADEGLVGTVVYEGIAEIEIRDMLKRLNRRDMDLTLYYGDKREDRWTFILENMFETRHERRGGVVRTYELGADSYALVRIENALNVRAMELGANLIVRSPDRRLAVEFGNVDRRVETANHVNVAYLVDNMDLKLRFEGLSTDGFRSVFPFAFRVDDLGGEAVWRNLMPGLDITLGNLEMDPDRDDYGRWSPDLNYALDYFQGFGSFRPGVAFEPLVLTGFFNGVLRGGGGDLWLRSSFEADLIYRRNLVFSARFDDDYVHVLGDMDQEPWQNRIFSLNRFRDYFARDDWLNRQGLDSVFIDLEYNRRGKAGPYSRELAFGFTRTVGVREYELPLEFKVSYVRARFFPSVMISIREYL